MIVLEEEYEMTDYDTPKSTINLEIKALGIELPLFERFYAQLTEQKALPPPEGFPPDQYQAISAYFYQKRLIQDNGTLNDSRLRSFGRRKRIEDSLFSDPSQNKF